MPAEQVVIDRLEIPAGVDFDSILVYIDSLVPYNLA